MTKTNAIRLVAVMLSSLFLLNICFADSFDLKDGSVNYAAAVTTPKDSSMISVSAEDLYSMNEKNMAMGVLGWCVFPSLGHALIGDWGRGAWFLAADAVGIGLILTAPDYLSRNTPSALPLIGVSIYLVSRVWELVDVVTYTNWSNDQLKKKYGLNVSLRHNDLVLQYSLNY